MAPARRTEGTGTEHDRSIYTEPPMRALDDRYCMGCAHQSTCKNDPQMPCTSMEGAQREGDEEPYGIKDSDDNDDKNKWAW